MTRCVSADWHLLLPEVRQAYYTSVQNHGKAAAGTDFLRSTVDKSSAPNSSLTPGLLASPTQLLPLQTTEGVSGQEPFHRDSGGWGSVRSPFVLQTPSIYQNAEGE